MTKASVERIARRKSGSPKLVETPPQEAQTQAQQMQLTPEQQYLQGLFDEAKNGKISTDKKVMIEMLAESEAAVKVGQEKANNIQRQIYDLQLAAKQLESALTNELGKARGLTEALLATMPKSKRKASQPES